MSQPIPQPPGVPLLGNIFDVDPSNTWTSLRKLTEKYGEIFQIKVFGHSIVFVGSAALAEEICDEKRFRKYVGGPIVEIRYTVHDSLFTAFDHEASWGIHHRIIAPGLSPSATGELFEGFRDTTSELIARWKEFPAGKKFAPLTDLNRLNLEATTLTLYGKKLNSLGFDHPVIKAMEDSTSEAVKRPTRPGFLNSLVYGGKLKSATKTLRAWAQELVDYRKANPTDRKDLLSALLSAKDPETGKGLTDAQVVDEIVCMPIGSSTAPCLIAAAILFLLQNPETMTKARAELDAVVGDGDLQYEHLAKIPYTEGIARESLRLSCAAPGFNIEPIPSEDKRPVLLAGGKYEVAHNQPMIIVLAGVNRDPAVYEDPLQFKPERMVGENFDRLPLGAKRWFGNGKRECIGKHYAEQWNLVVLAKLIKEVDFEAVDPAYKLEQDGWFNIRPVDFYVRAKPRSS